LQAPPVRGEGLVPLKGKAKADGEDVLTPLIQQAATNILTEVARK
jgi:hypothetical protein